MADRARRGGRQAEGIPLAALLRPALLERLRAHSWPDRPWFGRPTATRREAIERLPELHDLATLLKTPGVYLSAISPEFRSDQVQDRGLKIARARRLHADGWSLTVGGLHEVVPALGNLLGELAATFDLPAGGAFGRHRCIAYASPPGEALACHFDPSANFVLQLKGRKRWRVAENRTVKDPVDVYSTRLPPEQTGRLATYSGVGHLPKRMPGHARSIVASPGSFMFLPRGYWHETKALGESLSVHFVLHQPTWADVWTEAVSDQLVREAKWRAPASGLWSSDPATRRRAAARLKAVAAGWTEELRSMSADEAAAKIQKRR